MLIFHLKFYLRKNASFYNFVIIFNLRLPESQISKYIVEVFNDVFAHQLGKIKGGFRNKKIRVSNQGKNF